MQGPAPLDWIRWRELMNRSYCLLNINASIKEYNTGCVMKHSTNPPVGRYDTQDWVSCTDKHVLTGIKSMHSTKVA